VKRTFGETFRKDLVDGEVFGDYCGRFVIMKVKKNLRGCKQWSIRKYIHIEEMQEVKEMSRIEGMLSRLELEGMTEEGIDMWCRSMAYYAYKIKGEEFIREEIEKWLEMERLVRERDMKRVGEKEGKVGKEE
jgi:hypothetical protein